MFSSSFFFSSYFSCAASRSPGKVGAEGGRGRRREREREGGGGKEGEGRREEGKEGGREGRRMLCYMHVPDLPPSPQHTSCMKPAVLTDQ